MATNRNDQNTNKQNNTSNRGFASMDPQKQHEIASKGGHASAEKAGHEGMAERGRKGGEKRAEQLGHEGMAEMGRKGGESRSSSSSNTKSGSSNRGFATQPKSKVQEAARKGGQHSQGGRSSSNDTDEE